MLTFIRWKECNDLLGLYYLFRGNIEMYENPENRISKDKKGQICIPIVPENYIEGFLYSFLESIKDKVRFYDLYINNLNRRYFLTSRNFLEGYELFNPIEQFLFNNFERINRYCPKLTTFSIYGLRELDQLMKNISYEKKIFNQKKLCDIFKCAVPFPYSNTNLIIDDEIKTFAKDINDNEDYNSIPILGDILEGLGYDTMHATHQHNHYNCCWILREILKSK